MGKTCLEIIAQHTRLICGINGVGILKKIVMLITYVTVSRTVKNEMVFIFNRTSEAYMTHPLFPAKLLFTLAKTACVNM